MKKEDSVKIKVEWDSNSEDPGFNFRNYPRLISEVELTYLFGGLIYITKNGKTINSGKYIRTSKIFKKGKFEYREGFSDIFLGFFGFSNSILRDQILKDKKMK